MGRRSDLLDHAVRQCHCVSGVGTFRKTTIYGAIVAIVCCYKGMTAWGEAEGVGRAVNEAVRGAALTAVFAFDYSVHPDAARQRHPQILVIK